eukprot:1237367-Amorphochlora_amoeboformis.AAC.1
MSDIGSGDVGSGNSRRCGFWECMSEMSDIGPGDVGSGKTEVAIRAIYRNVLNKRQVQTKQ